MATDYGADGEKPSPDPGAEAQPASPGIPPGQPLAVQRFESCRWRKAAEPGAPAHCTHRDVLPIAGATGFAPEAWCEECGFFKVRRTPRKRPSPPPDERYYY